MSVQSGKPRNFGHIGNTCSQDFVVASLDLRSCLTQTFLTISLPKASSPSTITAFTPTASPTNCATKSLYFRRSTSISQHHAALRSKQPNLSVQHQKSKIVNLPTLTETAWNLRASADISILFGHRFLPKTCTGNFCQFVVVPPKRFLYFSR